MRGPTLKVFCRGLIAPVSRRQKGLSRLPYSACVAQCLPQLLLHDTLCRIVQVCKLDRGAIELGGMVEGQGQEGTFGGLQRSLTRTLALSRSQIVGQKCFWVGVSSAREGRCKPLMAASHDILGQTFGDDFPDPIVIDGE